MHQFQKLLIMQLSVFKKSNMSLSDKSIQEFKDIYKKKYGVDLSDEKARDYGSRLKAFVNILIDHAIIEHRRKKRLKKEPKGFFLDDNEGFYTCAICGETTQGNNIWWNLDGLRCADCWRNIQEKVIPPLIWNHDNKVWIQDCQIHSDYNVHPATAKKLRPLGKLSGRDLKRKNGMFIVQFILFVKTKNFLKSTQRNLK